MQFTADMLAIALIEGGSFIAEQNISRRDTERFDDILGRCLSDWSKRKFAEQEDIDFTANGIFLYCGKRVLQRFCIDVAALGFTTAYDFAKPLADLVTPGYQGLANCPLLDPYELAQRGGAMGWEHRWCPFRNAAEVLWTAGWKGLPKDAANVADARKFLAELQDDLQRRAELKAVGPLVATRLG